MRCSAVFSDSFLDIGARIDLSFIHLVLPIFYQLIQSPPLAEFVDIILNSPFMLLKKVT